MNWRSLPSYLRSAIIGGTLVLVIILVNLTCVNAIGANQYCALFAGLLTPLYYPLQLVLQNVVIPPIVTYLILILTGAILFAVINLISKLFSRK